MVFFILFEVMYIPEKTYQWNDEGPRMSIEKLLTGHRKHKERFAARKDTYLQLAEQGQDPDILWIGCSDSRVIPEQITSTNPGDLFTIRNVANIVPPAGSGNTAVGAVIEYAVLSLQVTDIIVCGHTECGGIGALFNEVDSTREPHISRWVSLARPALERVEGSDSPQKERYLETIKANVLLQLENLRTYECVRQVLESGDLVLHGWLYNLHTGDIHVYDPNADNWVVPV